MHETHRTMWEVVTQRVTEASCASRVAGTKFVRLPIVVVVDEEAVVGVPIVVQPQRGLVPIEQIGVVHATHLGLEGCHAIFLNHVASPNDGSASCGRYTGASVDRHLCLIRSRNAENVC